MNAAINRTCRASNKCEPPDIPVKFFANQHKLSCISSIHARINQKITKTAIGPKFPYRRKETRQTVKTTKSKNMAIENVRLWPFHLLGNSITLLIECLYSMLLNSITKFSFLFILRWTKMKNNHNLKFEQTTFKSQKNKDTSTNTKEINP